MFIFLTIKQLIFKRVRIKFYEQKNEFSMTVAFIAPVAVTFFLKIAKSKIFFLKIRAKSGNCIIQHDFQIVLNRGLC